MNSIESKLLDVIKQIMKKNTEPVDLPATVVRIAGQKAWVHFDGGVDETPASMTIDCKKGDSVMVRLSGGSAYIIGNYSAPPTDDAAAERADEHASEAFKSAAEAKNKVVESQKFIMNRVVKKGTSGINDISSTMLQDANGVNIYNNSLESGKPYAHIKNDAFQIRKASGSAVSESDTVVASFGQTSTIYGLNQNFKTEFNSNSIKITSTVSTRNTTLDQNHLFFRGVEVEPGEPEQDYAEYGYDGVAIFTNGHEVAYIDRDGNVAGNNFINLSDFRLKEKVPNLIDDLSAVRAQKYKYLNSDGRIHAGYIAQEIEAVAPDFVYKGKDGYKRLDYISVLVSKIEILEQKIKFLEEEVEKCRR
jgi:hypothetical protein